MKKVLSIVLSLVMVLCMMPVMAFAGTTNAAYSDISGEKCEGAVNVLDALGVIDGYEDGTYRPDQVVTRAEMAKLIITALGMDSYATATTSSYSDMQNAQWAIPVVEYATNLGIVEGVGNGRFSPGNPVTYEQAVTMIVRAIGYTTDCNEMNGTWPAIYVQKATALGLFKNVEGNQYGTGADRGDVAIMLYNALEIPQVYADKDGETLNKRGEAYTDENGNTVYSYITMMSILNKDGSAGYGILNSEDVDGAMADVRAYIGAAAKITKDKNDDVIALGDIKTTFLTGKYNKDNTFTVGDTDYICYPKYKTISKAGVTSTVNNAVSIVNGVTQQTRTTLAAGDTEYTIAATVEGKTITGIYSIATWNTENVKQVTSSDLTQISKNKKLLGYAFKQDNNGEIDTNSFILKGVDSLDKITEDNIVAVYTDGKATNPSITKVEVGTTVVTGEITKEYSDKITVNGTDYKFSTLKNATTINNEYVKAGNEVKLYLDYSGKIYAVDLVNGMAGNYAVVIDKTDVVAAAGDKFPTGLSANTAKIKLLFADGTIKTVEANASKLNDNKVTASAWNGLSETAYDVVTYQLNSSDQIINIAKANTENPTTGKISNSGYFNGYAITDNAAIFKVPGNVSTDNKDSDFTVVTKDSLKGTNVTVKYGYNDKNTMINVMLITSSSGTVDYYGILNSKYEDSDGTIFANGFIGSEALNDVEIDGTFAADTLFKMVKNGDGSYTITDIEADGTVTGATVNIKEDALYNGDTRLKAFASDVVVYVYDSKEKAYVVGDTSDITAADDTDTISYFVTNPDDDDKDNKGMITYVIITPAK